jgi:hypothetical protein
MTPTDVSASPTLKALYAAISQAVNDNSRSRVTARSLFDLLRGFAAYASPSNLSRYVSLAAGSVRFPWHKAMPFAEHHSASHPSDHFGKITESIT